MIWNRYRNEIVILLCAVLMAGALIYKNHRAKGLDRARIEVKDSLTEIGEIVALEKQWADKGLKKSVTGIRKMVPPEKVKLFSSRGKKLKAKFVGLEEKEVSAVVLKIENLAVEIEKLLIERKNGKYNLELKCKWQ